jgi:hypothetical protein
MQRRKPKAERKEIMLRFRVTSAQKQLFEVAARNTGLDVSAWLRLVAVREATPRVEFRHGGVTSSDLRYGTEPVTDPVFKASLRAGAKKLFCHKPHKKRRKT